MKHHTKFSSPRQSATTIATGLQGRRAGYGWMACCPAHEDRTPSLSICDGDDGKVLIHCHAGCEQDQVIAALRSRGVWEQTSHSRGGRSGPRPVCDDVKRSKAALAVWHSSIPASGTPVESYLASRRLDLPSMPTLRFHPALKHPQGVWPAMVALVTRGSDDRPLAIHRTFLARDGSGKALIDPQKMMLGPCRGGAVRLGTPGNVLMVGEGIETCLSAMQAKGHPAWAALSTSGLLALDLPDDVRDVIVLAERVTPHNAGSVKAVAFA